MYNFGYSHIREKDVVITSTFDLIHLIIKRLIKYYCKTGLEIQESDVSISGITIDDHDICYGYNEHGSTTSFNLSYSNILNSDEPISLDGAFIQFK